MTSRRDDVGMASGDAIGIIGGSGLYTWLSEVCDVTEHHVDTPFGSPSAPLTSGELDGRRVVFLPRHGRGHEFLPHTIPYRANLWALRQLGVGAVVAASAVGGLRTEFGPGTIAVPDQLIDRTSGRARTFFDGTVESGVEAGPVHIAFADPYCPKLRNALLQSGTDVTDGGTLVVIDGPRFSTRAESRRYIAEGASLINMTGDPEATLARELQLCYATICLVTDRDAGVVEGGGVTAAEVFAEFARNLPVLTDRLRSTIAAFDDGSDCGCAAGDHDPDLLLGRRPVDAVLR